MIFLQQFVFKKKVKGIKKAIRINEGTEKHRLF
jgi:hypothetical protein